MRATALVVLATLAAPATVAADSLTPVELSTGLPAIVRSDRAFSVRVSVRADPGVLDVRQGPLRAVVRLTTGECGGIPDGTSGPAVLDRALSPQPSPGRAYAGTVTASARLRTYATYTVCSYLVDDYEQFATQTGEQTITVSRPCTRAADTYDRAERDRHVSRARRAALARAARRACGSGVTL